MEEIYLTSWKKAGGEKKSKVMKNVEMLEQGLTGKKEARARRLLLERAFFLSYAQRPEEKAKLEWGEALVAEEAQSGLP